MNSVKITAVFMFYNLALLISASDTTQNERKPYIVYMGELPKRSRKTMEDDHHDILSDAIGDQKIARESKIYSYKRSFNGFAARLLPHEATYLSKKEGVVSVFPNTIQKLQTTRSWDFLGLTDDIGKTKRNPKAESNLIIGVLDTGIYVDSPSFNDKGFGPPPPKWKGKCAPAANFTGCNNKVIGAQYFNLAGSPVDQLSPVDTEGHGTHTASTAAGNSVTRASLYGLAEGTAKGGVPSARIAAYKVCWSVGCQDMDMLAAFDAAIADGVDVISVSIGGPARFYFEDSMAIGAFHAMKKGIMTACAAGNYGPDTSTIQNVAPWIFTAGASSIDRQFETDVKLGNGMTTKGISINTYSPKKTNVFFNKWSTSSQCQ
ncbi:subtilisin-like protease SBT4.15 [Heracleum sosnowskyi]|uniref:Subtilisin-like protease SBT4.15 n=1 Tax=Heracleum sosnowskyi TaxID=360622 RepID=A0AAD8MYI0_9APIA|nr:subtilisin-like protease SBT4.15 [Heracleum sosnowskyi]